MTVDKEESKPVMCIVLDGYHKGHMIRLPRVMQEIRLVRPRTITIDDCCDGEKVGDIQKGYEFYKLAFGSIDGETALYTWNGGSRQLWNMREWIGYTKGYEHWAEQKLYVSIHDPRATIDWESVKRAEENDND